MFNMLQGSIHLIPFPFSDGTGKKIRPVVVVSKNDCNNGEDVLVCALTSNTKTNGIIIDSANLQKGVLYNASCIKPFSLHAIEKSLLLKEIGVLDEGTFDLLRKELLSYF